MMIHIQELMKTNLFDPNLNSAIFDGPIRIYFNQAQESLALKLYFFLQKEIEHFLIHFNGSWSLVILIYPQAQFYYKRVSNPHGFYNIQNITENKLILTHAELQDHEFLELGTQVKQELNYLIQIHTGAYAHVI